MCTVVAHRLTPALKHRINPLKSVSHRLYPYRSAHLPLTVMSNHQCPPTFPFNPLAQSLGTILTRPTPIITPRHFFPTLFIIPSHPIAPPPLTRLARQLTSVQLTSRPSYLPACLPGRRACHRACAHRYTPLRIRTRFRLPPNRTHSQLLPFLQRLHSPPACFIVHTSLFVPKAPPSNGRLVQQDE